MITAKNYAAQAIKGISSKLLKFKDPAILLYQIELIEKAVKFVMPDGGVIFDSNLKGIRGQYAKLPYKRITVEYVTQYNGAFIKTLVLAEQEDKVINVSSFFAVGDRWEPCPVGIVLMGDWWDYSDKSLHCLGDGTAEFRLKCTPVSLYPNQFCEVEKDIDQGRVHGITNDVKSLLELLEALSCRNVTTSNFQDASSANVRRIKQGKLPIYETKMLVIDTRASSNSNGGNGGGHASPRQHLRRGHIRRLGSGNIWVNSCVVGDPQKGSINKQYSVM